MQGKDSGRNPVWTDNYSKLCFPLFLFLLRNRPMLTSFKGSLSHLHNYEEKGTELNAF